MSRTIGWHHPTGPDSEAYEGKSRTAYGGIRKQDDLVHDLDDQVQDLENAGSLICPQISTRPS